jgi:hypothetical protein
MARLVAAAVTRRDERDVPRPHRLEATVQRQPQRTRRACVVAPIASMTPGASVSNCG